MKLLATHHTTASAIKLALGLTAACLLSTVSVQAVNAASVGDTPRLVVKYDPQSLATESGVRTLYRRLESAAREVCPEQSTQGLIKSAAATQCEKELVTRAVRQINNSRLAEISLSNADRG
jgi:UrcA family protein